MDNLSIPRLWLSLNICNLQSFVRVFGRELVCYFSTTPPTMVEARGETQPEQWRVRDAGTGGVLSQNSSESM